MISPPNSSKLDSGSKISVESLDPEIGILIESLSTYIPSAEELSSNLILSRKASITEYFLKEIG
jgi:hypothetical protein